MKSINNEDYNYLTSVNHRDAIFTFVLKTISEEGEEDKYDICYNYQKTEESKEEKKIEPSDDSLMNQENWTIYEPLTFPEWIRPIGMRLSAYKTEGYNTVLNQPNTTGIYTRDVPFKVLSDGETITIFRQVTSESNEGNPVYKLFVDRFFFDTEAGVLANVNEIRYVRSSSPDVPESQVDTFGSSSPTGDNFLEPTSEILLNKDVDYFDFFFDVIEIPVSGQQYQSIWHIFVNHPVTSSFRIYSIPRSFSVLFDVSFLPIKSASGLFHTAQFGDNSGGYVITKFTTSIFNEQEEIMSKDGSLTSIKRGSNVMLVLGNTDTNHQALSSEALNFEVGIDGYLAGMEKDPSQLKYQDLSFETFDVYGTALQLDGRNDYITNSVNIDCDGFTIALLAKFENDYSRDFKRNIWSINNLQIEDDSKYSMSINYDQQGCFELLITDEDLETNVYTFNNTPSIQFNRWNSIQLIFPPADNETKIIELIINGRSFKANTSANIGLTNFRSSIFTVGLALQHPEIEYFQGVLSETRLYNRSIWNEIPLNEVPLESDDSLLICEAFNSGVGNIVTSFMDNAIYKSTTINGGEWISTTIPSSQNFKTLFYDKNLLKCSSCIIENTELQNTEVPLGVITDQQSTLLETTDGLLKLYYNRSSGHKIGVAHFDSSTSRYQSLYYWKTNEDEKYLILPKLIFTALHTGADMNDVNIVFGTGNRNTCLEINFEKQFHNSSTTPFVITEKWRNIPLSNEKGAITAQQITDIVNGKGNPIYSYTDSFIAMIEMDSGTIMEKEIPQFERTITYTGLEPEEYMPDQFASVLFQADCLKEQDKSQPLLVDFSDFDNQVIQQVVYGTDASWVLDPVLPSLYFQESNDYNISIPSDLTPVIKQDFSLEMWMNISELSENIEGGSLMNFGGKNVKFNLGFDQEGKFSAQIAPFKENGRLLTCTSELPLISIDHWQQVALTYKSGYAFNFYDGIYLEVEDNKSLTTESELTIETWYYFPESFSGKEVIASKWGYRNEEQSWALVVKKGERIDFSIMDEEGAGFKAKSDSQSLNVGEWNHIAARYAKASKRNMLFIDETKGDVDFLIPDLMSNQWQTELTIEFETAIDSNPEDDNFAFISYGGADKINFISIERDQNQKLFVRLVDTKVVFDDKANADYSDYIFKVGTVVHVALTYKLLDNVSALELFLNGISMGIKMINFNPSDTKINNITNGLWIIGGAYQQNYRDKVRNHFSGYLTDIRIWNVIRTSQQILDNINVSISQDSEGLLALFPLNKLPIVNQIDSSNKDKNDFTISNIVTGTQYISNGSGVSWGSVNVPSKMDILINGRPVTSEIKDSTGEETPVSGLPLQESKTNIYIGKGLETETTRENSLKGLNGQLDNFRIWKKYRLASQISYYQYNNLDEAIKKEKNINTFNALTAAWDFDQGYGNKIPDHKGENKAEIKNVALSEDHKSQSETLWIPSLFHGEFKIYINSVLASTKTEGCKGTINANTATTIGNHINGFIGEVRLWDKLLSKKEIKNKMHQILSGYETDLIGYWQIADGSGTKILDKTINKADGAFPGGNTSWKNVTMDDELEFPLPVNNDSPQVINISTNIPTRFNQTINENSNVTAQIYNNASQLFLGYFTKNENKVILSVEKEEEDFILVYIGQSQFDPKIVGFIEGAPPVPSENLTVDHPGNPDKYVNTSSVSFKHVEEQENEYELEASTNKEFENEDSGGANMGLSLELELGTPFVSTSFQIAEIEADIYFKNKIKGEVTASASKKVTIETKTNLDYSLGLGGAWESNIYNIPGVTADKLYVQAPRLYRPNNMGMAIVKSKTADMYAIQSRKSKRTLGYKFEVDPNIIEDSNLIMFKLNPAYVKNGSLDGRIGFDNDIQYPELETAPSKKESFYKAEEAYQLQTRIEKEQEEWKNKLIQTGLSQSAFNTASQKLNLVNTYVWTADGGFLKEDTQLLGSHSESYGGELKFSHDLEFNLDISSSFGSGMITGPGLKADIVLGYNLDIEIGKSNTSSGQFELDVNVGGEGFLSMQADITEKEPMVLNCIDDNFDDWKKWMNGGYTYPFCNDSTTSELYHWLKADERKLITEIDQADPPHLEKFLILRTGSLSWNWSNQGKEYTVEAIPQDLANGIPAKLKVTERNEPHKGQYPIMYKADNCPGKVTGYRFKSFYMHADQENFDLLKNGYEDGESIIDPDWLDDESNPDALAMKQALKKSNSIWRIFHRVTYISRVVPNNDIESQEFKDEESESGSSHWIDYTSQIFKKPDSISIASNYFLIKIIMGETDLDGYQLIEASNLSYDNLRANINLWISSNTDQFSLNDIEIERLFNLMLNYFKGYLLQDS